MNTMADEFIKRIKDAFREDNIVHMLKKAKLIDETNIKEQEVRKTINNCSDKYETFKATCSHTYGAAADATSTFFSVLFNKNNDSTPTHTQETSDSAEISGPHISPKIRSFISKYDRFNLDIDKLDHNIGTFKAKSKDMLVDAEKKALHIKSAVEQASNVFVSSYSERTKETQDGKKD